MAKKFFEQNGITLYLRDSHKMEDIQSGTVDLVVTDPPYGISFQSGYRIVKFNPIAGDNNLSWAEGALWEIHRVMKPDSALFLFTRWDVYSEWVPKVEKIFNVKNCIVWWKHGGGGMGDLEGSFAPEHEFIIFATKGNIKLPRRVADVIIQDRIPPSIKRHPTEKPVPLLQKVISLLDFSGTDYSKQLIVDPYSGCGSTLVAARNLGRRAIGYEKDPDGLEYAKVAAGRLAQIRMELGI